MKNNAIIRLLLFLKSWKREVAFLISLVAFTAVLDLAVPIIIQRLIDQLVLFFGSGASEMPVMTVMVAAFGILVVTIIGSAVSSYYGYRRFVFVTKLEDEIRLAATEKYLRLHALFHHGSTSGQIIGRIDRGTSAIYTILSDILGDNLLPPLITFFGVVIVIGASNPVIALMLFVPIPVYILTVKRITNRIYEIERQSQEAFEAESKEVYDAAANVLTVKKFVQEDAEISKQTVLRGKARTIQYEAERLWNFMENIKTAITTIGRTVVIALAGFFVLNGTNTIGEFVLFMTLQNMAYGPLMNLSSILPRVRRNSVRLERMFAILDEPVLVTDKPDAATLPLHREAIVFENVSFRYGEKPALKDISVKIPAGTTVALVGRSGSGKTTFVNLLLRSFDPDGGRITVDGYDLRDVTQKSLLSQVAIVPQEVDLFSRSIAENISYGRPGAAQDEIVRAAKTALAHDFIMETDKGYETVVGERGIKLSGGERQRVGIARAVLRDPRILVFDEATSHLDTESERLISKAIDALIKNRTTIIIAHRLSTVLKADMIVLFNQGKIEATGTHATLLRKSPTYRKLYSLQFKGA